MRRQKRQKASGAQDNQEIGGKGDMLMGEKEMEKKFCQVTAEQNMMERNRRKRYSEE